jgi:hypothetical protein
LAFNNEHPLLLAIAKVDQKSQSTPQNLITTKAHKKITIAFFFSPLLILKKKSKVP